MLKVCLRYLRDVFQRAAGAKMGPHAEQWIGKLIPCAIEAAAHADA